MNSTSQNVWVRTGGAYDQAQPTNFAWLTREQQTRCERLRQARMLFDGRHREYFVDEGRTQWNFPPIKSNGRVVKLYAMWNVLGLISNKQADLLFGERPSIRVEDKAAQASIDAIVDRSQLHKVLFAAAVEASWAGETFLEVIRQGSKPGERSGLAYINHVPATEIYPIGMPGADGQYEQYVRYATAKATVQINGQPTELSLLLETRYSVGAVTRTCFKLKEEQSGATRDGEISIDSWPAKRADGSSLPIAESTGLSRPSIVWVANQLINGFAVSDYDGLIEQQDTLNAKHTQIARVLAKHSDPKLMVPAAAADENGNFPTDKDVLWTQDGAPAGGGYGYLTWDAKIEPGQKDRDFALHALCTAAEFPASVLGLEESGADDSARKVRLKAMPALAKTARKAAYWQPAIKLAIAIAMEAESGAMPTLPIAVEMRDGLPEDEIDRANVISTLRAAKVISKRRSLRALYLDPAAIEEELSELDKENEAETPSVLFGEPGEPVGDDGAAVAAA